MAVRSLVGTEKGLRAAGLGYLPLDWGGFPNAVVQTGSSSVKTAIAKRELQTRGYSDAFVGYLLQYRGFVE
jgi:hypothetical protein